MLVLLRSNKRKTRWRTITPYTSISFPEAAILLVSDGDRGSRFFQRMTKGTPGDEVAYTYATTYVRMNCKEKEKK